MPLVNILIRLYHILKKQYCVILEQHYYFTFIDINVKIVIRRNADEYYNEFFIIQGGFNYEGRYQCIQLPQM